MSLSVTLAILASITSIAVNLYTLWTVRKVILGGIKKTAEEIKEKI
jgi:NADH:ubiquinone oxidoreductase subunit 4 (subunit M)